MLARSGCSSAKQATPSDSTRDEMESINGRGMSTSDALSIESPVEIVDHRGMWNARYVAGVSLQEDSNEKD